MLTLLESTGDRWGHWGHPMNSLVRSVPTLSPPEQTGDGSSQVILSPLQRTGDATGDAPTPINMGMSPLSPVVPTNF